MDDSPEKPTRVPIRPKKTPLYRTDGKLDKRVYNTGIPKGEKPKDRHFNVRITEDDLEWLNARPEGKTAWFEEILKREKGKESNP